MNGVSLLDFNDAAPQGWVQPAASLDREAILSRAKMQLEPLLQMLFPHGKRRGREFVVGNLQGEPGDSLCVALDGPRAGMWIDHATGESGDLFALWAAVRGYVLPGAFAELLGDMADWLVMPHAPRQPMAASASKPVLDALGPHTAKWDYLDTEGRLVACVYRYDTPSGKQYRPWDALRRKMSTPEIRPLYNLPRVVSADTVVLVEGEKCADALQSLGRVATTAMGGANAPVLKTDWSPLAGKTVIVWPDHDDAGAQYADTVIAHLQTLAGTSVRRVSIPQDKPAKWDAADALADGTDVTALIAAAQPVVATPSYHWNLSDWIACERFVGPPVARQWLVEGIFPMAQTSLIAAAGGVGKSFLLLALAREIAAFDGDRLNAPLCFGGALNVAGTAVYVTAEDDAIEMHNRLLSLGPIPPNLVTLPLPDAGGAKPLFAPEGGSRNPGTTVYWAQLTQQLVRIPQLRLIVLDPLQPLCALDLNVPENAQFVCSQLSALAAATGAAVIVSHHFAKREASTPEQAREAIRGTGGLVDGVRCVYAIWLPKEDHAKSICEKLSLNYQRNLVVQGGVVKANGRANLQVSTYIRSDSGLLVDQTYRLRHDPLDHASLLLQLRAAIAHAALEGFPYTKTAGNGVYERRFELPEPLNGLSKHRLVSMVDELLQGGQLVQAVAEGSKVAKWLDVPTGPLAQGDGDFEEGHLTPVHALQEPLQ